MRYRVTHLISGHVSELTAEKVRQIQENGFAALFKFEPIDEAKAGVLPEQSAETADFSNEKTEETEPEPQPKGKKGVK